MAKHLVFLVHGMGDFNDGWSADIQSFIRRTYSSFPTLNLFPFDEFYEFVEVNYNSLFEERRQAWKQKTEELTTALIANGLTDGAAKKLVELGGITSGDDFFRTHVLDVIMYRFLPQIAEQVRRNVQSTILNRLEAQPQNERVQWSVIAHSLGTCVTHDTLHAMFTHEVDGVMLPDAFKPVNLFMIANVSRLLWTDMGFYDGIVRPHPLRAVGVCERYCSFEHRLDPFPRVRPFHKPPETWLTDAVKGSKGYRFVRMPKEQIADWNVHGFFHHIQNPLVHVELLRALAWDDAISKQEYNERRAGFKTLPQKKLERVIAKLEAFTLTRLDTWEELTEAIVGFRGLLLEKGTGKNEGETQSG